MAEEPTEIAEQNQPNTESDDVAAPEATETEPAPPAQEEEEPAPQQEEAVEAPAAEGAAEAPDDEAGSGEAGEATVTASEQPAEAADGEEAATEEAHGKAEDDGEVGDAAAGEEEAKAEGEATDGDAAAEAGDQQQSDEAAAAEGAGTGEEAAAAEGEEGAAGGEATAETADGEGDGEAKAEGEEAAASGETGEGTGEEAMATGESAEDGQAEAADGEEGEQPPTSETFADGERAESPARVSEKLSREPTPTGEERQQADRIDEVDEEAERPEPTSPDEMVATFDEIGIEGEEEEEEEEEYEEEEVEEEEFNRELMIASYKQAMQEREQKLHQNSLLQTKLSDYFRRKKADQGGQAEASQETEKSITDQEQRYAKFVANLDELRRTRDSKRLEFDDRIQELELECQSREEEMRLLYQSQLDAKRKVGLKAVSATNGRPFPAVTQKRSEAAGGGKAQDPLSTSVDDMLQDEASLEDQVARVRLDNIGLSNRVRKCETSLKAKEELSEGLHMIDFEQLKIENQTYNEKIEERQEELLKLKKKITNNVQVLTHLKEKLQFVQCKRQEQCESLDQLDQTLSKRRDQLTRTKQTRDSLRNDNQRLKQNSGLLGNEALLRNFEENADLVTEKRGRLESLKTQHSEATLQCSKLKRKIDVARAQSAQ